MSSDTTTQDEIEFGNDSKPEKEEQNLPPLASNGGVNLWFSQESDKDGNEYLVLNMPGHQPIRLFFNEDAKPTMNNFKRQWESKRKQNGGGQ